MKNGSLLAEEFMEYGVLKSISIIDMHVHMGTVYGTYLPDASLESMMKTMEKENIEIIASAPHSALFDPVAGNSEIEETMKKYPGKIKGYFTYNPNYCENIKDVLGSFNTDNGYIGFKLLPDYHQYPLDGEKYKALFEFADDNKLVVLSHTWGGSRYDSVEMCKRVVSRYRNITFIMGHSAPGECDMAIDFARNENNVFLDLTDTHRLNGIIEKMVKQVSSEKVLFGTDFPWYDPNYCLGSILFSKIDDQDKCNIIHNNAKRILEKFN